MAQPPPNRPSKSLLRNLGAFFGHIAEGIKRPVGNGPGPARPDPPVQPRIVREQVQQQEVQTPQGKVVLRRRIIDEMEPPRPQP